MAKPTVVWIVLEMIPDGNGLDDVMSYLFHTEDDAKKAADRIRNESDSDAEFYSMPVLDYATWDEDFEAGLGGDDDEEEEDK